MQLHPVTFLLNILKTSFDILKKHINIFLRPKTRSIFGIHDPVGLRYLFQLRVSPFKKSQTAS